MPERAIELRGKTLAKFLDLNFVERSSMFLKHGGKLEFVKSGSKFKRMRNDKSVETAYFLGVRRDAFGIAHVRYKLSISRPKILPPYVEGSRTLALRAFTETYTGRHLEI